VVGGGLYFWRQQKQLFISPEAPYLTIEKPFEKYSFPKLRERAFIPDGIWTEGNMFYYWVDGKKISGQIHQPEGSVPIGGWPVVVMIRGYVDKDIYRPGIGTERAAEIFAKNGYVTLAPDFLGYGESDESFTNNLEDRFWSPIEVLQLMASLKNLANVNFEKVAIWAHSNGGQIALSVLEISGKSYPTTLWAPVSKPFPYSILYYTDEADDFGKALRRLVAGFEAMYDSDLYSINNYYDWINAPIQIHQGTADEPVPFKWSQDLEKNLTDLNKEVKLYLYPGADHNLAGGENAWSEAVARDLSWFNAH
jgi:dipeptidyl aminopeptidase/acylaminoacyl peptidase